MKRIENEIVFSPSDLSTFMRSHFTTWMDRLLLERPDAVRPDPPDETLQLARRKGLEHEARCLEAMVAEGAELHRLPRGKDPVRATAEAMRRGRPIIHHAELTRGRLRGVADLLVRTDGASSLGDYHYVPREIKLAFSSKPAHVIQLCAYARMLERAQSLLPSTLEIVHGNGKLTRLRTVDFLHQYLQLERAFVDHLERFDPEKEPLPEPRADHGRWRSHAERRLKERDHLSQIAGIRSSQIKLLEAAGLETMSALAGAQVERVARLDPGVLDRLRLQARMQIDSATLATPLYRVLPADPQRPPAGLALLPPAADGDLYFDIEGYPLVEGGLEYLFGVSWLEGGRRRFRDWWAHDPHQEREAFERFVDWVHERWRADPAMHVYHYAAYEVAALRRLMGRHATREAEIDQLLRHEVFVDLYAIVRRGVVVGEPHYSIKNLERLFREQRAGAVATAVDSLVQYERWLDSGQPEDWRESRILREIRDYNREDCDSTLLLTEWLRERQREQGIEFRGRPVDPDAVEEAEPLQPAVRRRQALARSILETENAAPGRLLAQLLEFHRREEKPMWWQMFLRHTMSDEELFADPDCLGRLARGTEPEIAGRGTIDLWYEFDPDQDSKLDVDRSCYLSHDLQARVRIVELDRDAGRVRLRFGKRALETMRWPPPRRLSLIPDEYIPSEPIQASIERSVERWRAGEGLPRAFEQLLRRDPPALDGAGSDGANLIGDGEAPADAVVRLVSRMDRTTLCIQGPPGSGKTTTAARAILELLRRGKRVGITSNSHKAVLNLMARCADRAGGELSSLKVGGRSDDPLLSRIPGVEHVSGGAAGAARARCVPLVGGTAWLFSREELRDSMDYLFVDEAGQVSLANLLGMAPCAANLVLIGDQMQLAQPIQGSHPDDSGSSTLEYLLRGERTISPDRGVFLDLSYRLHPEICRLHSEAFYEGKLRSAPGCERRRILFRKGGTISREAGILFLPTEHEGNTQGSEEEARVVHDVVQELLGSRYVGPNGSVAGRLSLEEILIVAPYNMQVRKIQRLLPEEARVGSVDRFQGQEAPVVILSMSASQAHDSPRGLEFLLNPNRINVALSRAQTLAVVIGNPGLAATRCRTLEQMKLVNLYCRIVEHA